MESLSRAHAGWINLEPALDPDDAPPPASGFFGLFSGRGPEVPLATWTPPSAPRRGRGEPPMVGLQHPAGAKARARLAELGRPVPEGWVVLQDHARKGLVVAVPPTAANTEVLRWLLGAAAALSMPGAPPAVTWRATIYEP